MKAGIALGSNLGDRLHFFQEARRHLFALHEGAEAILCSRIYETEPVDCPDGSASFLNAAIEIETSLSPLDLLARMQSIEVEFGRPKDHAFHGPRTIDLDLLYCDDLKLSHPSLTLPHPRIAERLFVLKPLADICPERILAGGRESLRTLCGRLEKIAPGPRTKVFPASFS
ncbi:MAG: 2-amino-4-hydroxy-6-hydroxymethyldihydropteridine diphosphokinase [Verrucomicrobiae bacterium]